jgi:uncharacterized membrane protein
MGYLFLILSVFSGSAKGYCGKRISGRVQGYKDAALANFIRMFFCIIIGAIFVVMGDGFSSFAIDTKTLLITFLSGVTTAGFVVFWIISVQNGAYVMLDIFLMLGVIITILGCRIFFGEEIRANQYIGFILLIISAFIMCGYNISIKGGFNFKSLLLLIACGVSNGLTNFSQKLFVYNYPNGDSAVFNFYTYIFAALVLLICFFIFSLKRPCKRENGKFLKGIIGYIIVMSVCLFMSSYFKVISAKFLDSAILYPISQGSALILSALMAGIFFKEKITFKCIFGMILAFFALLIINLF